MGPLRFIFFALVSVLALPSRHSEALELTRLDSFGVEAISAQSTLVHLYVTENCSVCQQQVEVLKDCVAPESVAAFIEGGSEEKLRNYVRRKKMPFKTYLLNSAAKQELGFGAASPSVTIKAKGKLTTYEGLRTCDQIIHFIKAGS